MKLFCLLEITPGGKNPLFKEKMKKLFAKWCEDPPPLTHFAPALGVKSKVLYQTSLAATWPGLLPRDQACCHVDRSAATWPGLLPRGQACCHVAQHVATRLDMLPLIVSLLYYLWFEGHAYLMALCHVVRHTVT
jgi:hypothetical protein